MSKIIAGIFALILALSVPSYAANRTHVSDTVGEGKSEFQLEATSTSAVISGDLLTGGVDLATSGNGAVTTFSASYIYGLNENADFGILFPFSTNNSSTLAYNGPGTQAILTNDAIGQGDASFGLWWVGYESDEEKWLVHAVATPPTAYHDGGQAQVTTNGTLAQKGSAETTGNGYLTVDLGLTVSFKSESIAGNPFIGLDYAFRGGKKDAQGNNVSTGNAANFTLGTEKMLTDSATFRPSVTYAYFDAADYTVYKLGSYYNLVFDAKVVQDISNHFSVELEGFYLLGGKTVARYASGTVLNLQENDLGATLILDWFF